MSDYQSNMPLNFGFSVPVLAAGSTTTLTTTNAMAYCINSRPYSATAWTNQATPTTDVVTGAAFVGVVANKGCVFIVGLNAAKAMKVVQGPIVDLDSAGAFKTAPLMGPPPNDFSAVGYVIIKAGSTANATTGWIFGTSNMASVSGITYTFGDLVGYPNRPFIS